MSENNHVAEQDSDSDPHLGTQSNGETESTIDQVTHVDLQDEVLEEAEDGMFEDCPDELNSFDGRQKEEEAVDTENGDEKEEESQILHIQQSGAAGELEQLRIKFENAVAEKESVVEEYQELLSARDREIENLNAKVSELVLSNESLQVSSQARFEKDGHIDDVVDRIIYSLATVVNREQVSDDSRSGKIVYIEENTALLIEKYNQFLSEIYQLGQSFSEVGLGSIANEYGNILVDARGGLLELKRKEEELSQKLSHLEDENRKLVEELDKEKVIIGTLNTELGNVKVELEQEKVKCANTKEKLSMAVTKGKALVQQRDSLKSSLAGKSSELEKCLIELQEKSAALEVAELTKEELAQSDNMVASLNNSLQQSHAIFEQVEEILSHAELDQPEMLDLPERLRWLVDDRNKLKGAFLELRKLKDSLSLLDFPESVSSSDLESQMNWLIDSFRKAHNNIYALQEEVSTIKEASINHIDQMSISLLVDSQEKDYLQAELADLRFEYGELVGKNHQISLEKDQIVKMLIDFSGLNMNDEGIDQFSSTTLMIIDLCFQKLKGQNGSPSEASHIDYALFEKIQSLLYVRDQSLMLYEDILEEDFLIRSDVNMLTKELKVVSEEVIALKEERSSLLKDLERSEEIQSLLYVRDQSLTLYEDILEEDLLIRSDVNKLSNELKVVSEEVIALKEERDSLLKDLGRSEEKTGMLRDKLSMAVKKGKGLVQDRDNLKGIINEKNSEIEQLKVDLQKHESEVSEYKDEIKRLSSDLESIPKLEADLLEIKMEKNQFEQFLMESNNMLQRVMECIDGIVLPDDPVFGEPIDKVKWLAGFVNDCQDAKVHVEQQLQLVKDEANILEVKLAETQETVNSLGQRLSSSEDTVSQLAEEKIELEREKEKAVEELQKVKEKIAEACSTSKLLEDALSQAEKNISALSEEKEQAQISRVAAETELERVRDEAVRQTGELAEASRTIKDLEVELSQVESKVNFLTEKYDADQVVKTDLENELRKLQDEAANNASKSVDAEIELERVRDEAVRQTGELAEARRTIKDLEVELSQVESKFNLLTEKNNADQVVKTDLENELKKLQDEAENNVSHSVGSSATIISLEDELLKARDDISTLENANEIAKQEISSLSSKLSSYMLDLSEKNGRLSTKSLALLTSFNYLLTLIRDDALFFKIKQSFETKCETLKKVHLTVNKVNSYLTLAAKDSEGHLEMEEDPPVRKPFTGILEKFEVEIDKGETITIDTIISSIGKIADELMLRSKHIADTFNEFSDSIDEFLSPLPGKLLETESNIIAIVEHMKIMKDEANSVAKLNEEKDNIIAFLENDINLLLSSCTDSTNELQNEVHQNLGQLGSTFEVEKFNHEADEQVEHHRNSKYADASRKLINASGKVQTLIKQFKYKSEQADTTVRDLQAKLNETTVAFELATEEKDVNKNRVLQLESDIQSLEIVCSELKDKVEGYHGLEEKLKEKEEEISSMHSALMAKEEESSILSASQLRDIFDKIDRIDIPIVESEDDLEIHTSDPVKKLSYIIDSVTRLHHQMNSLSHDKKEMQTILDTKVLEINDLKEEVKQLNRHCEDSKMVKSELFELTSVLEKIIDILGANDWVVDRKSKGVKELLPALEKHIIAILSESENSKSKAQELGIKLVGSQKVIDELTTKVNLLEDSIQDRNSQPEIVQERNIYEAPLLPASSEITEVEEGSRGNKKLSPVPSAAHVRSMRKGSTDHLALDISMESDNLISSTDTNDDKGHVFKSLNTSGFVPKQGKLIADRIDGIWVSGSGILMSRPRARLGLIGYILIMHIWLLGTVL
ncbi:trans-Golgi network-localized SYP41-interacting protein 1 [Vicia villosa]|uniref:trans-Golgi network-localized SYP41-interacting protein 1 n=1 Tax=Vicia villosa TaxID=3911 RepID=UPI00273B32E5|nr:trans-Golgi network-localized SYP41-interacting protein 1 [Vicia villosa]XP_058787046.1 trans-Golgi network-localized SYP41-interacting protein 1 [Vicia villosa]